ncbi:helix-turn-helix protein [Micromonospora pisi]|uniref:Helix-turn-helix protein n=1 Tax=Micromonospora pisi TaxID=589240 RepID=A0A495JHM1_9ACTN|nr:helix-turn-helix transcriptional regulator [Micromonospora pisi]RKR87894.1 helix-turn-helix protein [Micromonospora pisi]
MHRWREGSGWKSGITQDQAGTAINVSASLIAAIENGRLVPQPDTAAQLDDLFGTGDKVQRAANEARDDARPTWLRPWTDHEQRAVLLRTFESMLVPGLLQTEAYARAVLRGSRLSHDEVERTTQVRHERQAATVEQDDAPMLSAVLGEFALTCGPPDVLGPQLKHLLDMSERPKVQILVVPRSAGLHAGLAGAFVLATLPAKGRTGYVDDQLRGRLVVEGGDLDRLEVAWEIVTGLAVPVHLSRDLIVKAIEDHD